MLEFFEIMLSVPVGAFKDKYISHLLQHVEVPVPIPKKDELLLKLEATSINPFDWRIQKGVLRPFLPRKFPHIPGNSLLCVVLLTEPFCEALFT